MYDMTLWSEYEMIQRISSTADDILIKFFGTCCLKDIFVGNELKELTEKYNRMLEYICYRE